MTLREVAEAVAGELLPPADPGTRVTAGVRVDSRLVVAGDLFVAVPGERVDGHDFAARAATAGAVGVLADRPLAEVSAACIVVDDTTRALGALATAVLTRLANLTVIGVTGSSGKTSTKDLLAAVLGRQAATVAPVGSFNNEIGLPLSVLRADADTRHLVLEYSARGLGHIARLCRIAPPDIAVELNVGSAHLGEFGSRATIAAAKAELVEALPTDGVAVLNADDPLVAGMAERTRARIVTFASARTATVWADGVALDELGRPTFTLHGHGAAAEVTLRLHGAHQVTNALATAAVGLELGMSVSRVAEALTTAVPRSRWRMEVTDTAEGITVVNDAYNANPESMRAALAALVALSGGGRRRTWAVLGEMAELGAYAADEHDEIGRLVARLGVSRLVAVGPAAAQIHAGTAAEGSWDGESTAVPDIEAALALLGRELAPGDVVLVKASRSSGLERVAGALTGESMPT